MILNKPLIAAEIAKRFDAILIGKSDNKITSINEIHKVREGSITFVDHLKYYQKVLDSEATIIIITHNGQRPALRAKPPKI